MSTYAIVPATEAHVQAMEGRVRQADVDELRAAGGRAPGEAMLEGLRLSSEAWAGLADGQVMCIFGVVQTSILAREGTPWMVGSDLVDRHARAFLLRSRPVVATWAARFDLLWNFVDARNRRAITWLRWLGFQIGEPEPFGVEGRPFHRFEMRSRHV